MTSTVPRTPINYTLTSIKYVGGYIWEEGAVTFNLKTKPSWWRRFWVRVIFGAVWKDA